jgi:UDP:flavonoid glycosyltransferase YjiC (YdhE family)
LSTAIVFYVSGHGYGHASRVIEVINAILAQRPETRIGVRTAAPRWLFDLTIRGRISFSHLETDTGIVQLDSLALDEADSIRRAAAFHAELMTRAASETRMLREINAGLVVGDIPPLAFSVAAAAGLPSIAIGNFTWDWIYADYPRVRLAPSLLPAIRSAYAKASLALRLPMNGGFESFSTARDIPFIARHATQPRDQVCRLLKLPADKPLVLLSFGGYGLSSMDDEALTRFRKYTIVTTTNVPLGRAKKESGAERRGSFISLNEEAIYDAGVRYEDLVAAAEAVVTKPGYGIVSECIANDTAVLYTSRGHFAEYDVIVEEMPAYIRCAFVSQDDLFAGKWEPHLDRLLAQPKPKKKADTNGANAAADILLGALDRPPRKPRRPKAVKL